MASKDSQQRATRLHPEPDKSSQETPTYYINTTSLVFTPTSIK
jgi:hypothetical protein